MRLNYILIIISKVISTKLIDVSKFKLDLGGNP